MAHILEVSNHRIVRNDHPDVFCHSVGAWVPWANGVYIEEGLYVEGPLDRWGAEQRLHVYASMQGQKAQACGNARKSA